jgi:hypothetical protein
MKRQEETWIIKSFIKTFSNGKIKTLKINEIQNEILP